MSRRIWDGFIIGVRNTFGRLIAALFRVKWVGIENVPRRGSGAILAGNHVSYMDPVLLWIGYPGAPRVRFMAKSELFEIRVLGSLLPRLWAFPVRRGTPDRKAIKTATSTLAEGGLVGIFPEGTRNRTGADLGEAQGGVAFISMHANAEIVPVGIANTDKIMPSGTHFPRFPKITIVYCDPICPDDIPGETRKERMEALTAEIMRRISQARNEARKAAGT